MIKFNLQLFAGTSYVVIDNQTFQFGWTNTNSWEDVASTPNLYNFYISINEDGKVLFKGKRLTLNNVDVQPSDLLVPDMMGQYVSKNEPDFELGRILCLKNTDNDLIAFGESSIGDGSYYYEIIDSLSSFTGGTYVSFGGGSDNDITMRITIHYNNQEITFNVYNIYIDEEYGYTITIQDTLSQAQQKLNGTPFIDALRTKDDKTIIAGRYIEPEEDDIDALVFIEYDKNHFQLGLRDTFDEGNFIKTTEILSSCLLNSDSYLSILSQIEEDEARLELLQQFAVVSYFSEAYPMIFLSNIKPQQPDISVSGNNVSFTIEVDYGYNTSFLRANIYNLDTNTLEVIYGYDFENGVANTTLENGNYIVQCYDYEYLVYSDYINLTIGNDDEPQPQATSNIKIGSTTISKIYLGSTQVEKIYLGETLVFGGGEPEPPSTKLGTPTISVDGVILSINYVDTRTESFDIYINDQLYTNVEWEPEVFNITNTIYYGENINALVASSANILQSSSTNPTTFSQRQDSVVLNYTFDNINQPYAEFPVKCYATNCDCSLNKISNNSFSITLTNPTGDITVGPDFNGFTLDVSVGSPNLAVLIGNKETITIPTSFLGNNLDTINSTNFINCTNLIFEEGIRLINTFKNAHYDHLVIPSTLESSSLNNLNENMRTFGDGQQVEYGWTTSLPDNAFKNNIEGQSTFYIKSTITSLGTNSLFNNIGSSTTVATNKPIIDIYYLQPQGIDVSFGTQVIAQGNSKNTLTYNIYTDNESCKTAMESYKDQYTTVNLYHLDGSDWS